MTETTSAPAIYDRVRDRLEKVGKSARAVSIASGGVHVLSNLRRGSVPSIETIVKLAAELDTRPEFLAFGIDSDDVPARVSRPQRFPALASVPVIGEVAAGRWLDVDTPIDESPYAGIEVPPDPDYPVDVQFAVVTRGTSVNKIAPDGTVLGCIDTRRMMIEPPSGSLVIAEQVRGGGHEISRTAKVLRRTPDGAELWPHSDDPRWTQPLRIRPGVEDEDVSVVIIGLVTWVHRKLDHSELRPTELDMA